MSVETYIINMKGQIKDHLLRDISISPPTNIDDDIWSNFSDYLELAEKKISQIFDEGCCSIEDKWLAYSIAWSIKKAIYREEMGGRNYEEDYIDFICLCARDDIRWAGREIKNGIIELNREKAVMIGKGFAIHKMRRQ